jgi:hypothetical protein
MISMLCSSNCVQGAGEDPLDDRGTKVASALSKRIIEQLARNRNPKQRLRRLPKAS